MQAQKLSKNLPQVKRSSCHMTHKSPLTTMTLVQKEILQTGQSTSFSQGKKNKGWKIACIQNWSSGSFLFFLNEFFSPSHTKFQCSFLFSCWGFTGICTGTDWTLSWARGPPIERITQSYMYNLQIFPRERFFETTNLFNKAAGCLFGFSYHWRWYWGIRTASTTLRSRAAAIMQLNEVARCF